LRASIFHLYHSGVAVRSSNNLLVFDYFNDYPAAGKDQSTEAFSGGVIGKKELSTPEEVFVFVSHNHGDHYNSIIFEWEEYRPDIKYIISDDIKAFRDSDNINVVSKDQEINTGGIRVKTFGSTDKGVSFLVELEGIKIFHAGDLNWWYWDNFSEEQLAVEEREYKDEIAKIKGENIDIAFVPVDPRLGDYYHLGGDYFIKEIKPALFVPIHFADNYSITTQYYRRMKKEGTEVAVIKGRGERIIYDY